MFELASAVGQIDGITLSALAVMALAGLVVGIAPGSYPLAAVAVGLSADRASSGDPPVANRAFRLSLGYALGIVAVDVLLGALFGVVGFVVLDVLIPVMAYAYLALAVLLAAASLALWRAIRIPFRLLSATPRGATTMRSAFALGLAFGLTTCPACTPLILPVLIGASATGDVVMGAGLLLVFGLARSVPILVAGTMAGALARMMELTRLALWFDRIVGALVMAAGLWFAYQGAIYAGWVPA